jgi:hypothetical protein
MKRLQSEPANLLHDIYQRFINSSLLLREKVCEECSMSIPTFYRKMRPEVSQRQPISNAEKDAILKMAQLVVKDLEELLCKYKEN